MSEGTEVVAVAPHRLHNAADSSGRALDMATRQAKYPRYLSSKHRLEQHHHSKEYCLGPLQITLALTEHPQRDQAPAN